MEETGTKRPIVKILLISLAIMLCVATGFFVIWRKTRPQPASPEQTTSRATTLDTTAAPADVTPPVITGAADKAVILGETVSYRTGVTATDPEEGEVSVQVDASAVDATKAGTYPVVYWAEDSAGNRTEVTVQVTVAQAEAEETEPEADTVKKDYAYYAQKVYQKIIKKGMTEKEKIKAIWKWCRYKISFSGHTEKDSWKKAAVTGFTKLKGDCYVYFATAKALLEQAGITTKDVVKIKMEGRSDHYWLLVKYKGSWYHFDACPRRGANGKTFCLYTDQQMLEFSEAHEDCFDFDLRLYPRTPGTIADKYLIKFYPELFDENGNRLEEASPEAEPTETTPPEATEEPTSETTEAVDS